MTDAVLRFRWVGCSHSQNFVDLVVVVVVVADLVIGDFSMLSIIVYPS